MERYSIEDVENAGKRKILLVAACDIARGGVSVFINSILSHMDLSKFCIHIYTPREIVSQQMADELLKLGVALYIGGCREGEPLRERAWEDLEQLMASMQYDVIHCNSGKVWINYFSCYFGMKYNVPKRIVHSHSALLPRTNPEVQKQDDEYREYIRRNATDFLACSDKAAKWLFGEDFKQYQSIQNGIDTDKYRFNEKVRTTYRKELNLESKVVIGHVGRFTKAKNHAFLLDIYKEVTLMCENSILLLVGEGELLESMKEKAKEIGIEDTCLFLGSRSDVPELLHAMDVFLFPSLFEGLPISVLEAQTNGLPCTISENISEEVCITKLVKRIPLEKTAQYWAEKAVGQIHKKGGRESHISEVEQAGYSVHVSSDKLYQLYVS